MTGSENYHEAVRKYLTAYMMTIPQELTTVLPSRITVRQYLQKSNMASLSVWATEVEITAMASCLQTDIYVYSFTEQTWKWLKYTASQSQANIRNKYNAIYLKHTNQNHFEVVTSTQDLQNLLKNNTVTNCPEIELLSKELERQIKWASNKNSNNPSEKTQCIMNKESVRKQINRKTISQRKQHITRQNDKERRRFNREQFSRHEKELAEKANLNRKRLFKDKLPEDDKELVKRSDLNRKRLFRDKHSQDYKELAKKAAVKRMKIFHKM